MLARTIMTLLLATLGATAAADAIYRHVDAQGRITYSDQAPEGTEQVELPPVNTVPAERSRAAPGTATAQKPDAAGYSSLTIAGVTNGAELMNPQEPVTITVLAIPGLRRGDRIILRDNGQEIGQAGQHTFEQVDRGQHVLEAEIVDEAGNVQITAPVVTFIVQRPSLLTPARKNLEKKKKLKR